MAILDHVVDGSVDEGVGYGSYTSRGLTQFAFLAANHLPGVPAAGGKWLSRHFDFYLATVFNNFEMTGGVADSGPTWFYGPASQIRYLDTFVLRSGCGNWLADKIVAGQKHVGPAPAGIITTLHTEFAWYDPSLAPSSCSLAKQEILTQAEATQTQLQLQMNTPAPPPPPAPQGRLHVFSDWGYATYGSAAAGYRQTFLSLKASSMGGRAVNRIVSEALRGVTRTVGDKPLTWRNFNAGHEHPDQGSFVFFPDGLPLVTEGYYSNKLTSLQNTLLFRPTNMAWATDAENCALPYIGQVGGCGKYLAYRSLSTAAASAEIVSAETDTESGMVLMAAEFANWYDKKLGLESVHRTLTLVAPDVLLVVDHIQRKSDASTRATHMSAIFNNFYSEFRLLDEHNNAAAIVPEKVAGTYKGPSFATSNNDSSSAGASNINGQVVWAAESGVAIHAEVGSIKAGREGTVNFLNITAPLQRNAGQTTMRMAYAFVGPKAKVQTLKFTAAAGDGKCDTSGAHLYLAITRARAGGGSGESHMQSSTRAVVHEHFAVAVATEHADIYSRTKFLGVAGKVRVRKFVQSDDGGGPATSSPSGEEVAEVILGIPNPIRQHCANLGTASNSLPRSSSAEADGICTGKTSPRIITDLAFKPSGDVDKKGNKFQSWKEVVRFSPIISRGGTVPFLYCDIPKCGVSRWRRLVRRVEGIKNWADKLAHNPNENGLTYLANLPARQQDLIANDPEITSFVIVRDPFIRVLSGWIDKVNLTAFQFGSNFKLPKDFPTFVKELAAMPIHRVNEHFKPMVSFCGIGNGMRFDRVLKLEDIHVWGNEIAKKLAIDKMIATGLTGSFFPSSDDNIIHNHHSASRARQYYTPESVKLVRQMYRADFDVFGYSTTSPLLL